MNLTPREQRLVTIMRELVAEWKDSGELEEILQPRKPLPVIVGS